MLDLLCDAGRRSLLVQRDHRIVGEFVYQIETDSGSFSATQILLQKHGDTYVISDDILGAGASPLVSFEDKVELRDDALAFTRVWTVHSRTVTTLSIDYRIRATSSRVGVFPGVRYHHGSARTPVPRLHAAIRDLTIPGVAAGSDDEMTTLVLDDAPRGISFDLRESGGMPAVTLAVPVFSSRITIGFLLVPSVGLHRALDSLVRHAWQGVSLPLDGRRLVEYLDMKPRHLESEFFRESPGVAAVVPRQGRRRAQRVAAFRPFHGLAAAHAMALTGDLSAALDSTRFFLQGKRQDGALSDVYDRDRRKWGSHAPNFSSGAADDFAMANSALHLSHIDRLLAAGGRAHPEIGRAVSDVVSHLIERVTGEQPGGFDVDSLVRNAAVVTALAELRRQRGKNSVRAAALTRLHGALMGNLEEPATLIRAASRRDDLVAVVRACNDLSECGFSTGTAHAVACWLLASWFYSRALEFPRRSAAGRLSIDTTGLGVVSEVRRHLDFEALPVAVELARAEGRGAAGGLTPVAAAIVRANVQAMASVPGLRNLPAGAQPAELDHLEWSSRGRRGRPGQMLRTRIAQSSHAIIAAHEILERFPGLFARG